MSPITGYLRKIVTLSYQFRWNYSPTKIALTRSAIIYIQLLLPADLYLHAALTWLGNLNAGSDSPERCCIVESEKSITGL